MNRSIFAVVLLLLGALCLTWYFYARKTDVLPIRDPVVGQSQDSANAGPQSPSAQVSDPARYPVPPPEPAAIESGPAVPKFPQELDQADAYLAEQLPQLVEDRSLLELLQLNHFIEKLVLIIDKLPERTIPRPHLPIVPPSPGFLVSPSEGEPVISQQNAERYLPYVRLAEALPTEPLVRMYRGLYPLFQKAYRDLGHPDGHFNDRLVAVIDHLLQTPRPQGPIRLVPHVSRYQYADPELEAMSYGQKVLLRMGPANAERIKVRLVSLREELRSGA